jgi:hypothetical protein
MKKLIALLACVATLPAFAGSWITTGVQTNPSVNTILSDTVTVICASTVAMFVALEQRDSLNLSNVKTQALGVVANGSTEVTFPGVSYSSNERFRIRLLAGVTGQVQCSIIHFGT